MRAENATGIRLAVALSTPLRPSVGGMGDQRLCSGRSCPLTTTEKFWTLYGLSS